MGLLAACRRVLLPAHAHTRRLSLARTITFSEEVRQARLEGRPLVALESTIITHGMPYPTNLETAVAVEEVIRKQGATPATIAILGGRVTVGLTGAQLAALAASRSAIKVSRRDLAYVVAEQLDGATTVAGTIVVAELAGIPVFATGGLGGVHRAGQHTLDVSADLTELGRSGTCVVCSGVKSILDVPRTLEYLETQGVCVASFGSSRAFPAFYTRASGCDAPCRLPDAAAAARVLLAASALRMRSGLLVAVPVPPEHAMDATEMEAAIEEALAEAARGGVRGKEVTPFLLAAVARATRGRSLAANIALIKNNAKVGADIAVEFAKLQKSSESSVKSPESSLKSSESSVKSSESSVKSSESSVKSSESSVKSSESSVKPSGTPSASASLGNTFSRGYHTGGIREEDKLAPLVIGGANLDTTYHLSDADLKVCMPKVPIIKQK